MENKWNLMSVSDISPEKSRNRLYSLYSFTPRTLKKFISLFISPEQDTSEI